MKKLTTEKKKKTEYGAKQAIPVQAQPHEKLPTCFVEVPMGKASNFHPVNSL